MPGGSRFDFSIRGDEQEQHRIQLEHNLQHTDLSLLLSSTPEDYSLEYPRHNSAPSAPFSVFHSMDPSRDDFDADDRYSPMHAWSYRTAEDEDGVNPYGGETISTAAHHASALTLSAGLGGRGVRRDISLSGAEYDPDRPLHDLVANIDSKFSLFDVDRTRSRNLPVSASSAKESRCFSHCRHAIKLEVESHPIRPSCRRHHGRTRPLISAPGLPSHTYSHALASFTPLICIIDV